MNIYRITALILGGMVLLTGCGSTTAEAASAETAPPQKETANAKADTQQDETVNAETEAPEKETVNPDSTDSAASPKGEITAVEAVCPETVGEGMNAEEFLNSDAYWEWLENYEEKTEVSVGMQEGMDPYYEAVLGELLGKETDENTVCSPLNIYVALSMLAEVTDGNTRAQVLNVLQEDDIEQLRSRTQALWDANYLDTPVIKSQLANSMWLRNDFSYHSDTLRRLAEDYHSSSYSGVMGTEEMNAMLQGWTDDHTGGLLSEYTKDMELNQDTVLALVSAIYYKVAWHDKFEEDLTDTAEFHGTAGDQQVSMMHKDKKMTYYRTDRLKAVSLGLTDSGRMYFLLPEEGTDVKEIVTDPDAIKIIRNPYETESSNPIVHLSVPKFKVSDKTDLLGHLKSLGITEVTNPYAADFTPLTDETDAIWLSGAEHAAMVEIDEEGVTGAAYTEEVMDALGIMAETEEVDFVLDRPFYFAVTGKDGSILFAGVVQKIE